jgi:hypothetical protein
MNSFGIMVDKVDLSQLGVSLSLALNQIESEYTDIDAIVFAGEASRLPTLARFAIYQQFECWSYNGPVIATNINTAQILSKCPCPTKKYFYVFDLSWIYLFTQPAYQVLQSIFQNNDIKLIARSQSHYDVLTRVWQEPVAILEDFNYKQLLNILNK